MKLALVEFTLLTLITGAAARTVTVLLYSVVPPAWSFTVTALLPDVPLGVQLKRAKVASRAPEMVLAQSATLRASVTGKFVPMT